MSAPKVGMREANEVSYGFLAERTSIALLQALNARSLSEDDLAILQRASSFLNEIADGALNTATGSFAEGVRPSTSIAALEVALGPLESLKQLVRNDQHQIAPVFRRLADAVGAVKSGRVRRTERPSIQEAQIFFDEMSGWLANELQNRKRSAARARSHV